jgi:hypothetical protein
MTILREAAHSLQVAGGAEIERRARGLFIAHTPPGSINLIAIHSTECVCVCASPCENFPMRRADETMSHTKSLAAAVTDLLCISLKNHPPLGAKCKKYQISKAPS